MKKCLLLAAMVLAGCGQQGAIEDAIKAHLKDPGSAQFRKVLVNREGTAACAIWNAKNSLGGYGEWTVTELKKTSKGWHVSSMELRPDHCTEEWFASNERHDEARKKIEETMDKLPPEVRKDLEAIMNPTSKEEAEKAEKADKELQDLVKGMDKK